MFIINMSLLVIGVNKQNIITLVIKLNPDYPQHKTKKCKQCNRIILSLKNVVRF